MIFSNLVGDHHALDVSDTAFYPIDIITPEWLKFYKLNPMYIYVTLFRDPLLYQKVPEMGLWVGGFLYGFLIFSFGWWFFTKNSNEFAYRA